MKVGIIGAGDVAQRIHIPAYKALDDIELTAVCDIDNRRAEAVKEKFGFKEYYTNPFDMFEQQLELVDICTPPKTHKDLAILAIKNDSNVLIEKPMTSTAREADEVINYANSKKSKVSVVHNDLFFPVMLKAKLIIQKGEIGNVISTDIRGLESEYSKYVSREHWSHNLRGGRFEENLPHYLFITNDLINIKDIVYVYGDKLSNRDWMKLDELRILLRGKGAYGIIHLSMNSPVDIFTVNIQGTKMNLLIDIPSFSIIKYKPRDTHPRSILKDRVKLGLEDLASTLAFPFRLKLNKEYVLSGHFHLISEFIKSIRENKKPPVTAKEGKRIVSLQDKIFDRLGF